MTVKSDTEQLSGDSQEGWEEDVGEMEGRF